MRYGTIEEADADMNLNGKENASECKESPIADLFAVDTSLLSEGKTER